LLRPSLWRTGSWLYLLDVVIQQVSVSRGSRAPVRLRQLILQWFTLFFQKRALQFIVMIRSLFLLLLLLMILYASILTLFASDIMEAASLMDDNPDAPAGNGSVTNFKSMFYTIWTLYNMVLLNGWSDIFWSARCGAANSDYNSAWIQILLFVWLVLGSFVIGNMIIGFIADSLGSATGDDIFAGLGSVKMGPAVFQVEASARRTTFSFFYKDRKWQFSRKKESEGVELHENLVEDIWPTLLDLVCKGTLKCKRCFKANDQDRKTCIACEAPLSVDCYRYTGFVGDVVWDKMKKRLRKPGAQDDGELLLHLEEIQDFERWTCDSLPEQLQSEAALELEELCMESWIDKDLDDIDENAANRNIV